MSNQYETLAASTMFTRLPKAAVERLAAIAVERHYQPGAEIVREGESGIAFFVIADGDATVSRGDEATPRRTLHRGDSFGEMAIVDGAPRTASVHAATAVTALAIPRWDFMAEVRSNPDLAVEMIDMLTHRVRELERRVDELEHR